MRISLEIAGRALIEELPDRFRDGDKCYDESGFGKRIYFAGVSFDNPDEFGVFEGVAHLAIGFARCWSRPNGLVLPACIAVLRAAGYDLEIPIDPKPGDRGSKIIAAATQQQESALID